MAVSHNCSVIQGRQRIIPECLRKGGRPLCGSDSHYRNHQQRLFLFERLKDWELRKTDKQSKNLLRGSKINESQGPEQCVGAASPDASFKRSSRISVRTPNRRFKKNKKKRPCGTNTSARENKSNPLLKGYKQMRVRCRVKLEARGPSALLTVLNRVVASSRASAVSRSRDQSVRVCGGACTCVKHAARTILWALLGRRWLLVLFGPLMEEDTGRRRRRGRMESFLSAIPICDVTRD